MSHPILQPLKLSNTAFPMLPILLILTFVILSLLHVHWAFGGTIGSTATIPIVNNEPLFEPARMDAWLVALALACCAVLMAWLAGLLSWWSPRGRVFRWMGYALSTVFLIRAIGDFNYGGIFKQVQGTASHTTTPRSIHRSVYSSPSPSFFSFEETSHLKTS